MRWAVNHVPRAVAQQVVRGERRIRARDEQDLERVLRPSDRIEPSPRRSTDEAGIEEHDVHIVRAVGELVRIGEHHGGSNELFAQMLELRGERPVPRDDRDRAVDDPCPSVTLPAPHGDPSSGPPSRPWPGPHYKAIVT